MPSQAPPSLADAQSSYASYSLTFESDRKRLTPTAVQAFRNLVTRWSLTGEQAAALLGVSTSTWERLKQSTPAGALSQDQLTRISGLVGIFKGLHLLFADDLADRWPSLPNRGSLFNGQTPIALMIAGGIPLILLVRNHVDALRGGL